MRWIILGLSLSLLAGPALAQQGLRDGEAPFEASELTDLLSDHAVEFFDGSVSRYRGDGAYSYKYTDTDRPWLGAWRVTGEGAVCVTFQDGASRCDTFVSDGTRLVLVIADGTRFPIRERRALVDGY